jgi:hypothetical protein
MNQTEINETIDSFIRLRSSIDLEPSEARRIELYEELQTLKASILANCQNNNIIKLIIRLIQNGLI